MAYQWQTMGPPDQARCRCALDCRPGSPYSAGCEAVRGRGCGIRAEPHRPDPRFHPRSGLSGRPHPRAVGGHPGSENDPRRLMAEFRAEASRRMKPASQVGLAIILAIWLVAGGFLAWLVWRRL